MQSILQSVACFACTCSKLTRHANGRSAYAATRNQSFAGALLFGCVNWLLIMASSWSQIGRVSRLRGAISNGQASEAVSDHLQFPGGNGAVLFRSFWMDRECRQPAWVPRNQHGLGGGHSGRHMARTSPGTEFRSTVYCRRRRASLRQARSTDGGSTHYSADRPP